MNSRWVAAGLCPAGSMGSGEEEVAEWAITTRWPRAYGASWSAAKAARPRRSACTAAKAGWSGDGWQVAADGGDSLVGDAGAIAVFSHALSIGGDDGQAAVDLDDFSEVKEMGSCSPPFMAGRTAEALERKRWEAAWGAGSSDMGAPISPGRGLAAAGIHWWGAGAGRGPWSGYGR